MRFRLLCVANRSRLRTVQIFLWLVQLSTGFVRIRFLSPASTGSWKHLLTKTPTQKIAGAEKHQPRKTPQTKTQASKNPGTTFLEKNSERVCSFASFIVHFVSFTVNSCNNLQPLSASSSSDTVLYVLSWKCVKHCKWLICWKRLSPWIPGCRGRIKIEEIIDRTKHKQFPLWSRGCLHLNPESHVLKHKHEHILMAWLCLRQISFRVALRVVVCCLFWMLSRGSVGLQPAGVS